MSDSIQEIKQKAVVIASYGKPDKKRFLRYFFEALTPETRQELLEWCFRIVYDKKYDEINRRLDSIFRKKEITPKVAAQMIRHYMKIPWVMMPLLIKLAQRAKARVQARKRSCQNRKKSQDT
ncbi:MAG: hypothetical protein ACPLSN_06795 [Dictyoglomus turgidum]